MQCSIVVRAFNESQHLGRLLEGIAHQTLEDVEVILVDSGSTDSTVQMAQDFGAKVVHIPADEFSFGGALNVGLQAARREHVVIASAHVYPVYPDWLECLLEPFADSLVAVVYGKQRGAESSRFSERQILDQWFPEHDIAHQASPFCNNANAAIRRSLWAQHPYDETLTALEDVAWAKWAQQQGHRVSCAAHAEIIHVHHEAPRAVRTRYRREAMAFKRIFPEAHFSIYDFVRLALGAILSDFSHAVGHHAAWRQLGSILWFRVAQFWGTYEGYRHSSAITQQLRETFYYPRGYVRRVATEREVERIRYEV